MLNKLYVDPVLIDEIHFEQKRTIRKDSKRPIITVKATSDIIKYILDYGTLKLYATTINNSNMIYFISSEINDYNGTMTVSTAKDFSVTLENTSLYLTQHATDKNIIDITTKSRASVKYIPVFDEEDFTAVEK